MKHSASRWIPAVLAGLFLTSCAAIPRRVAFNEADFARFRGSGSGTVSGRAFTELRDKTIRVADNTPIDLEPVTAYTTETRDRKCIGGEKLESPDARLSNYIQEVTSDADGNFRFTHVAPGDYYLFCWVQWRDRENHVGGDDSATAMYNQWIYTRVSVRNGSAITVSNWNQGK